MLDVVAFCLAVLCGSVGLVCGGVWWGNILVVCVGYLVCNSGIVSWVMGCLV